MTIDEAIKIKENHQRLHPDIYYQELLEADNLGIEALKRLQTLREIGAMSSGIPLPGETEE